MRRVSLTSVRRALSVKTPQLKGELGVILSERGNVAEKIHIVYRAVGSSSATTRISLSDLRHPENVAPGVSYWSETACASPARNISLASSWTRPGGLPIARVRWSTGKGRWRLQRAGSNEISPLPSLIRIFSAKWAGAKGGSRIDCQWQCRGQESGRWWRWRLRLTSIYPWSHGLYSPTSFVHPNHDLESIPIVSS